MILALKVRTTAFECDSRLCLIRLSKFDFTTMKRRAKLAREAWNTDKLFLRAKYIFYGDLVVTDWDCDLVPLDAMDELQGGDGLAIISEASDEAWNDLDHEDFTVGGVAIYLDEKDMYIEAWEKHSGEEFFSSPFTLETVKECLK